MGKEPKYAELHCISNFTFLRGASHPEELVKQAHALGYTALAVTDECSLAGIVRAHCAAKDLGLKLIVGSEFVLSNGLSFVLLATSLVGYKNLSKLITLGRRAADKGCYFLSLSDFESSLFECLLLWLPDKEAMLSRGSSQGDMAQWLQVWFPERAWIAVELLHEPFDEEYLTACQNVGQQYGLPLLASGDVHMHARGRRFLQDTLTAIRHNTSLSQAGKQLYASGERHLRQLVLLESLYPQALLIETIRVASRCHFSLDELRYEYPEEVVPQDTTATLHLRILTEEGICQRWPEGVERRVRDQIDHELTLIAELNYESYFLTVHDIVKFARSRGILCQGRGSAANSAVCFCIGITEVDPARMSLLFERFISKERNEPPDIDIDFENDRREEVVQYIYQKYGRDRAALAATVITYRARSAIRDVGKTLGMDIDQVERLAKVHMWWDGKRVVEDRLREAGFNPNNPLIRRLMVLVDLIIGFPRHLSQHVGGFVITRGLLSEMVPIENASMPQRTIIQWNKDDLDALGILKIDCLCLGMLSAIRRSFDLIEQLRGYRLTLATIPAEDPEVYERIQDADTIGVFQIESRAQMAMLPRLRPANFYDLVIEVAIVRPGPIQGDMVHPYLRRRQGKEAVEYPSEAVRAVLKRTLGVPIFQEQVMKIAVVAAGFSPGEADQLRRSMAAWKRHGGLEPFEKRLIEGMRERGYAEEFARRIFDQIKGFGEYGFPESHAASFALLVYVSAWLKCYEPAAFCCALLNSQPMGFYAPSQLVQDVRRHAVQVLEVDVLKSDWDCTLESSGDPSLRLGLCMIKGLSAAAAERLLEARQKRDFSTVEDMALRAGLSRHDVTALARAGALKYVAGNRHQAHWQASGVEEALPLFEFISQTMPGSISEPRDNVVPMLPRPTEGEDIVADYANLRLTLGRHPVAVLRDHLGERVRSSVMVRETPHGRLIRTAGLVISRQRPGTANNVFFLTLEDESGVINLIVWPNIAEAQRRELLHAELLEVAGEVQREGKVIHVIAKRLFDRSHLLGDLIVRSRDFH